LITNEQYKEELVIMTTYYDQITIQYSRYWL